MKDLTVMQKVKTLFKRDEVSAARSTALRAYKEGKLSEEDTQIILAGLERMTVNIQTLSIDNSMSSGAKVVHGDDKSVDICQSEINGIPDLIHRLQ